MAHVKDEDWVEVASTGQDEEAARVKQAGVIAAICRMVGKKKPDGPTTYPTTQKDKQAPNLPGMGKEAGMQGAAVGGFVGAAAGIGRHIARLSGLLAPTAEAAARRAASHTLASTATARVAKGGAPLSAAEHAATQDVAHIKAHAALGGKSLVQDPIGHLKAFGPSLLSHGASWGAGGAVAGHAAEYGMKKYKQQQMINTAKKWALPAAAGLVGYKVLTD